MRYSIHTPTSLLAAQIKHAYIRVYVVGSSPKSVRVSSYDICLLVRRLSLVCIGGMRHNRFSENVDRHGRRPQMVAPNSAAANDRVEVYDVYMMHVTYMLCCAASLQSMSVDRADKRPKHTCVRACVRIRSANSAIKLARARCVRDLATACCWHTGAQTQAPCCVHVC